MGKPKAPRHGSMGVWPRVRAKRTYPHIRAWNQDKKEKGLLAFPAYKAGMTHVMATDTRKNSATKGETISIPTTILECPAIKIYSVRAYTTDAYGRKVATEAVVGKDKHLARKVHTKKTHEAKLKDLKAEDYSEITVTVMTQPSKTGIGQKRPEIFEAQIGGTVAEQLAWAIEHAGKEIKLSEVFKEGDYADTRGVTRGKGIQGPVRRFGIMLKPHKSEKGRRAVGTLGGWSAQQHFMYRVAHAGQMGYHQRTQYNIQILKIGEQPSDVTPKGGFLHYGTIRSEYVMVKGSVQGAKKRIVTLTKPVRIPIRQPLPTIEMVSLESQQGN